MWNEGVVMIRAMVCPICGREVVKGMPEEKSFVPFCSQRCQQVDFHRWWQGRYAIVEEVDENDEGREEIADIG